MKRTCIALAAVIALASCGDDGTPSPVTPPTDGPLRIGHLVSGDRISYRNGAALAVDEVNARGGLLGRPVELVSEVGIEEAAVAAQVAERMIVTDEVVAIIGPNRSTHAVEVGPVAQRRGVPMVTTAATNPSVTEAGDLVFMAAYTDRFQGGVMARFASETLGVSTAAFLTERGDVYAEGIAEFFARSFHELGGTVVAEEFYDAGATYVTLLGDLQQGVSLPMSAGIALDVSLDWWNSMDNAAQCACLRAGKVQERAFAEFTAGDNAQAIDVGVSNHGVEVLSLPQADIDRWAELTPDLFGRAADAMDAHGPGREIVDRYLELTQASEAEIDRLWEEAWENRFERWDCN